MWNECFITYSAEGCDEWKEGSRNTVFIDV